MKTFLLAATITLLASCSNGEPKDLKKKDFLTNQARQDSVKMAVVQSK